MGDELDVELPSGWWVSVLLIFTIGLVIGAAAVGMLWWLT